MDFSFFAGMLAEAIKFKFLNVDNKLEDLRGITQLVNTLLYDGDQRSMQHIPHMGGSNECHDSCFSSISSSVWLGSAKQLYWSRAYASTCAAHDHGIVIHGALFAPAAWRLSVARCLRAVEVSLPESACCHIHAGAHKRLV